MACANAGYSHQKNSIHPAMPTLVVCFWVGATISSAIVFAQFFQVNTPLDEFMTPLLGSTRAFANLAQPNNAATLLLMGWAGLGLLCHPKRCAPWAWWLGSVVLLASVVLTQSRTGILSATAVAFAGALIAWRSPASSPQLRPGHWMGALGLFAAMTAGFHLSGGGSGVETMSTVGGRPVLWAQIWAGLMESTWVGYGWLQTSAAQQVGALTVPGLEQTHYSHNLFLDLLVWNGIPLGLALITGGLGWLWWSWRRRPVAERLWPLVLLLPLAVHSMLEMPFAYAYFLFPAAMVLGSWHAMGDPVPAAGSIGAMREKTPTLPWRAAWWTLCAAYTALCALVAWEYTRVEEDFRIARFENMRIGQTPADYERPRFIVLTQLGDALAAMRLRAQPGMAAEDIQLLQRASRRYPWAPLHFRLTLALALNGQPEAAKQRLHLMHNLHGPEMHREALANLRGLLPQYPQLAAVLD